ncbi:MAG TPA: metallophosphoesterase [Gemmatimonadales bacterium]|nr:metallophosphoesterase [Gemmatimonadales bacterium]
MASLLIAGLLSCSPAAAGRRSPAPPPPPAVPPPPVPPAPPPGSVVFVGAGDIAVCGDNDDEATAKLLDDIAGTVFTTGDNAYDDGTHSEFARCYHPTWGRHKARTRPVAGNHDYETSGAAGYFRYFGDAAGDPTKGYYSYDLGVWHIVVLNSNVSMRAGSPQELWLKADLAASTKRCTVALWHHPRFSSGTHHGNDSRSQAIWNVLYDAGAELVLVGHEHNYERFAPQTPTGVADSARGVRQIVIGTGGRGFYPFGTPLPTSEVRNNDTFGVLKLTLSDGSYTWEFVPVAGKTFTDSGTDTCH